MKWLITNLLKLSKLDAGTAEFNVQKISSNDVISQSLKPFLITLDLKNITLKNTAHDFSFNGDFNWSVEAIENIIKNCMEHTDKNGTISISSSHSNIYDEIITVTTEQAYAAARLTVTTDAVLHPKICRIFLSDFITAKIHRAKAWA